MRKHACKFIGLSILVPLFLILMRCASPSLCPLDGVASDPNNTKGEARECPEALKQIDSVGIFICSGNLHNDNYLGEKLEKALSHTFVVIPRTDARYLLLVYPEWSAKKRVTLWGYGAYSNFPWTPDGEPLKSPVANAMWHLSFRVRCSVLDVDKMEVLYSFESRWDKRDVSKPSDHWTRREGCVLQALSELAMKVAMELLECKRCDQLATTASPRYTRRMLGCP